MAEYISASYPCYDKPHSGLEVTNVGYYGMYETALINDCVIAHLYSHNGAMGTTEWNQTCRKDYTWSMLNSNVEFLGKDCSSVDIATCLGICRYCRLNRTPLSSSLY